MSLIHTQCQRQRHADRGRMAAPWPLVLLLLLVLLLVAVLALWAAFWRDSSLSRVRGSGVLRIGYAVEAPYAWVAPDGSVAGESPETARHTAERLAVKRIEWVQVPFADLIAGLDERRFDVAAAGLFITEARARLVRFSEPTVRVVPGLLVQRGNPRGVVSSLGLARSAARVAVLEGSVEQTRLLALGVAPERLVAVPDAQTGRAAVARGSVDALALSVPTLTWMAHELPGAFVVLPDAAAHGSGGDRVAFAFHRDAAALQAAWNAAQAGWVGSAEHRRLVASLGFVNDDLLARTPPLAAASR